MRQKAFHPIISAKFEEANSLALLGKSSEDLIPA
jgi:hypothetical protein